jgi:hypothetical protein
MPAMKRSFFTAHRGVALLVLAACVFSAGFLAGHRTRAASVGPGSDADPLVSQSYVDQFVGLVVVELTTGQRLEGQGGTEIVLRSGRARAVASAQGGVCDLTAGKDLADGERVSSNHLLVVPRSDGRGIVADSLVFVMVRGPYVKK